MSCCPSDDDVRAAVTSSFLEELCAAADTGDKLSSRRRSVKTSRRAADCKDRNLAMTSTVSGRFAGQVDVCACKQRMSVDTVVKDGGEKRVDEIWA